MSVWLRKILLTENGDSHQACTCNGNVMENIKALKRRTGLNNLQELFQV